MVHVGVRDRVRVRVRIKVRIWVRVRVRDRVMNPVEIAARGERLFLDVSSCTLSFRQQKVWGLG